MVGLKHRRVSQICFYKKHVRSTPRAVQIRVCRYIGSLGFEIQIKHYLGVWSRFMWPSISNQYAPMLCIKNLRVVFLNMSKTSLYFIKTDTECTELINQKDENKHFFACVVRVCLETPQLFTHPNLHTVEQSYLTCYHFKWGKPKTQTPSKLCQKIGYGKTSLHIK